MQKLSFIVGVYNTPSNKLKRCVQSIINQTYQNLEIIFLDDGSTNNAAGLCDEFAKLDTRVKVFHQKNFGTHSKFEIGYLLATGDYITNVDHDDFIELDYYSKLMEIANSRDIDVVDAGYYYHNFNNHTIEKLFADNYIEIKGRDNIIKALTNGTLPVDSWCRIFKRKYIKRGKEWLLGEPSTFIGAQTLVHLAYAGYHWDQIENSSGNGTLNQWQIDQFRKFAIKDNFDYSLSIYPFLKEFLVKSYYAYLLEVTVVHSHIKKLTEAEFVNLKKYHELIKESHFILEYSTSKQRLFYIGMNFSIFRLLLRYLLKLRRSILRCSRKMR